MSTTNTAPFSISPTLSATQTQNPPPPPAWGGSGGRQGLQSLYLYTFLVALFLLVGVSSAIIVRSSMRWRYRPITDGTGISYPRRVSVDLRKTPLLWDAWVQPPVHAYGRENEKDVWDEIMPAAASYSPSSNTTAPSSIPPPPSLTNPTSTKPSHRPPATPAMEQPRVRVTVLIAMPAPGMFPASDDYSAPTPTAARTTPRTPTWTTCASTLRVLQELPHIEVGVASVAVMAHKNEDGDEAEHDSEDEDGSPAK
ncbi:hypothetical protein B0H12DRAFT_1156513 [Mycena haematopus]|nr:hypothetical protein B0H12DRAFT_1156513 [Mycena haematopus]